jgi:hypothetical protein
MIDYNKFYLVSFDVAKKLKELGYSEETLHHYIYDGNEAKTVSFGSPKKSLKINQYETFNAPTQGYVVRELRDKYKILVLPQVLKVKKEIKYSFDICDLNPELSANDWILFDNFNDAEDWYDTEEDATDAGLLKGLSILQERNIVWE